MIECLAHLEEIFVYLGAQIIRPVQTLLSYPATINDQAERPD